MAQNIPPERFENLDFISPEKRSSADLNASETISEPADFSEAPSLSKEESKLLEKEINNFSKVKTQESIADQAPSFNSEDPTLAVISKLMKSEGKTPEDFKDYGPHEIAEALMNVGINSEE